MAGRVAPHELQKRAPAAQGFPQVLQKKTASAAACGNAVVAGCAGAAWGRGSGESAQTNATIQPMNVHPARRFNSNIPVKLGWFRARYAGRKYRNRDTSRKMGWK